MCQIYVQQVAYDQREPIIYTLVINLYDNVHKAKKLRSTFFKKQVKN